MRDNGFARAQAAYDARLPDYYDDVPMTCPECDGDTDNYDDDGALPCDDCKTYPCDHCGAECKADDLSEWLPPTGRLPSEDLCWSCYTAVEPSPAEDGRW